MVDMLLLIGLVVCAHVFLGALERLGGEHGRLAQLVAFGTALAAAGLVFTAVSLAMRGTASPGTP